jgi:hypothetical protein
MDDTYIDAKLKLIQKYSKKSRRLSQLKQNVDTFITINDFLSNEMSLGPNAEPGDINYLYSNYENINHYMKILIDEIGFNKIVCMPNFSLKTGDVYIVRNTIEFNITRDELIIPIDLIKNIEKCKKRFMYINLMIRWNYKLNTHVNMIIIDFQNKTIERYEPHGKKLSTINKKDKNVSKDIDSKFTFKILSYIGLDNYTYISPFDYSPVIGAQVKADAYDGMCLTYSIMYLQLRIMNPDVDQKDIVKYMIKKSKSEMIDTILKYAKYIEENLKNVSNQIISSDNKLYDETRFKNIKFIVVNKRNDIDEMEF